MESEDIRRLAGIWGTEVTRESAREVQMRCPFAAFGRHRHSVDQNPNFGVKPSTGPSVCHCFSCGEGGLLLHVAHKLWMLSEDDGRYRDAYHFAKKAEVAAPLGVQSLAPRDAAPPKEDPSLERIVRMSRGGVSPTLSARGVTDADVRKWNLGFDPLTQRDVFPVYDVDNRLVAMTGRRISDEDYPKYWSGYGQDPDAITRVFYGECFLDPTVREGILVEGPLDTIATSRQYPNVLGQCGVQTVTRERKMRLKRWFKVVTLLYDADAAGRGGLFKVGLDLFKCLTLFVAILPEGLDPFGATASQRAKALRERVLWSLVDWGSGKGCPAAIG